VKGGVPPETETAADPLDPPKQFTGITDAIDADGPPILEMAAAAETIQPCASVTVTE